MVKEKELSNEETAGQLKEQFGFAQTVINTFETKTDRDNGESKKNLSEYAALYFERENGYLSDAKARRLRHLADKLNITGREMAEQKRSFLEYYKIKLKKEWWKELTKGEEEGMSDAEWSELTGEPEEEEIPQEMCFEEDGKSVFLGEKPSRYEEKRLEELGRQIPQEAKDTLDREVDKALELKRKYLEELTGEYFGDKDLAMVDLTNGLKLPEEKDVSDTKASKTSDDKEKDKYPSNPRDIKKEYDKKGFEYKPAPDQRKKEDNQGRQLAQKTMSGKTYG